MSRAATTLKLQLACGYHVCTLVLAQYQESVAARCPYLKELEHGLGLLIGSLEPTTQQVTCI